MKKMIFDPRITYKRPEIILTELLRLKQFQKRSLSGTSFIVNSITVEKNLLTFALLPTFGYVFQLIEEPNEYLGGTGSSPFEACIF